MLLINDQVLHEQLEGTGSCLVLRIFLLVSLEHGLENLLVAREVLGQALERFHPFMVIEQVLHILLIEIEYTSKDLLEVPLSLFQDLFI